MDSNIILSLVILFVAGAAAGGIAYGVMRFRRAKREFAKLAWGTDTIREGIEKQQFEYETTPKSISSATSLYLPRIIEDYPEFSFEEARGRAENVLVSYLQSIDEGAPKKVKGASRALEESLRLKVDTLKSAGQTERFEKIKVHRCEIAGYTKAKGRATITFQISVQYKHALFDSDGECIRGDLNKYEQSRYDVDMVHIQDISKIERDSDWGLALNCPNCGAPLPGVGAKVCEYCGTPVVEYNIKTWSFHRVEEC